MNSGCEQSAAPEGASAGVGIAPLQPPRAKPRKLWVRASLALLNTELRAIVRKGTLTVIAPDGFSSAFGSGDPSVTIRLTDWRAVRRLSLNPDLALGEAYMDGTLVIESAGLYDFLDLCLANLDVGEGHWLRDARALSRRLGRRFAQHNPVSVARANAAHHYDLSDTLYGLFLDADRQYSCAYYLTPDDTLEQAQAQKKRHIAAKLLLQPSQRVLDIGSGWGGFGLYLAQVAGVEVTGVTLSTEQHRYSNHQAAAADLTDKVKFHLKDYRQENGRFDRIVSIGMFEHVGVGHYNEFFAKIRDLMADDGVALIHTIGSAGGPGAAQPWIRKYIFPGGYTPALSEVVPAIERAGLFITDIEILRLHYAETLKEWRRRFMANRGRVAAIYDDRFCRMWEFYLAGCEAAFRRSDLVVFQIQLSKRFDAVPVTRDYIQQWEHAPEAVPQQIAEPGPPARV